MSYLVFQILNTLISLCPVQYAKSLPSSSQSGTELAIRRKVIRL